MDENCFDSSSTSITNVLIKFDTSLSNLKCPKDLLFSAYSYEIKCSPKVFFNRKSQILKIQKIVFIQTRGHVAHNKLIFG